MTTSSQAWWPFVIGSAAFFLVMGGATVPTPLYPIYSDTFGFSPFQITLIFAVYSLGVIGTLLGTGPWSDEIGRKPVLIGGLVLALASLVVFYLASGLPLLLLARFLQGASVGIFTSAATLAVKELAPEGRDATGEIGATSANMAGLGMGSVLAGVIVAVLPEPLRTPYAVHLALTAAATLAFLFVPEPSRTADDPRLRPQGLAVPKEVRALFVPAAISCFASFMMCGFMGAIVPSFLGQVLGYEGWHVLIGITAGLIFLTSCIGQAAETGMKTATALPLGMGILTVGIGIITAVLWTGSLIGLIAGIAITGVGHGIAFKSGLTALSHEAPEGRASAITATYFTVAYVAIAIPVLVIGALQEPVGLQPVAVGYGLASTLLSAVSFAVILRRKS